MKRIYSNIVIALSILVAAVLYLLSLLESTRSTFDGFNLSFAIVIAVGLPAIMYILRACFENSRVEFRQLFATIGIGLAIIAVFALISALALPANLILPIIAILLAIALIVMVIARGTRQWDKGDNQYTQHKTYAQRKDEESQKSIENQIK